MISRGRVWRAALSQLRAGPGRCPGTWCKQELNNKYGGLHEVEHGWSAVIPDADSHGMLYHVSSIWTQTWNVSIHCCILTTSMIVFRAAHLLHAAIKQPAHLLFVLVIPVTHLNIYPAPKRLMISLLHYLYSEFASSCFAPVLLCGVHWPS